MSLLIKRTTLAHKLFCDITIFLTDSFRFFPALLYLSSTTPFYASVVSKAAAGMIFHLRYGAAAGFEPATYLSKNGRYTSLAIEAV